MTFVKEYLKEISSVASLISEEDIEKVVEGLVYIRENGGRLFILGVGGSAANASHATNDFRKIAGIEAYAPTDNVAEFTARANDEGWETTFEGFLKVSKLCNLDALLILSVGGGNLEKGISVNLCKASDFAKNLGCKIYCIVGRHVGYVQVQADVSIHIPVPTPDFLTPISESFQAVVWHLLVSHPKLKVNATKW
jgi:D-sedoheptulose 7-phosphate isomerase